MIKIIHADTHLKKLKGLMLQKNINYGMFFPKVNSIHTFFMKEPIDVIGLNKDLVITEIHYNIVPNKILFLNKSIHTLELPKGYSKNYKIGQKVKL